MFSFPSLLSPDNPCSTGATDSTETAEAVEALEVCGPGEVGGHATEPALVQEPASNPAAEPEIVHEPKLEPKAEPAAESEIVHEPAAKPAAESETVHEPAAVPAAETQSTHEKVKQKLMKKSKKQIHAMKVAQLREVCRQLGIDTSGKKSELVARLVAIIQAGSE